MSDEIQSGIYFRSGEAPPPAYRLLLLNVPAGASRGGARTALKSIWTRLDALREGSIPELRGQPDGHRASTEKQFVDLRVLVAYGRRLFDRRAHEVSMTISQRPTHLTYLDRSSPFPSLAWAETTQPGEADIALQFTASSAAAVNCAAVEVWKAIEDDALPLEPVATYEGFGRLDRRGWLEFHDGVSNMDSAVRGYALAAKQPPWMRGGTYMTFLRIRIDLRAWRALGRSQQEVAVGRDKLTGAALREIRDRADGELIPVARSLDADDPQAISDWRDPPQGGGHLERAHIHRANQSRASPGAPGAFRMFRQGYEFLATIDSHGPGLGLNFVSFQSDLRAFQHVMNAPGWLGDTTFGGNAPKALLRLEAGGFYAVPPVAAPFPGWALFEER